VNTAHKSRQHRQRLKMSLPANRHRTAMELTGQNYADDHRLSKLFLRKKRGDF
jgi:hypothetical protein